jgi:hypothetical protein
MRGTYPTAADAKWGDFRAAEGAAASLVAIRPSDMPWGKFGYNAARGAGFIDEHEKG